MESNRIVRTAAFALLAVAAAAGLGALLLRDFLAWEQRPLLRKRAQGVLARVEAGVAARHPAEVA